MKQGLHSVIIDTDQVVVIVTAVIIIVVIIVVAIVAQAAGEPEVLDGGGSVGRRRHDRIYDIRSFRNVTLWLNVLLFL